MVKTPGSISISSVIRQQQGGFGQNGELNTNTFSSAANSKSASLDSNSCWASASWAGFTECREADDERLQPLRKPSRQTEGDNSEQREEANGKIRILTQTKNNFHRKLTKLLRGFKYKIKKKSKVKIITISHDFPSNNMKIASWERIEIHQAFLWKFTRLSYGSINVWRKTQREKNILRDKIK